MLKKEVRDHIRKYVHPFRITSGQGFHLTDIDPADTCGVKLDKGEAAELLSEGTAHLAEEQEMLLLTTSGSPGSSLRVPLVKRWRTSDSATRRLIPRRRRNSLKHVKHLLMKRRVRGEGNAVVVRLCRKPPSVICNQRPIQVENRL
jgi:hypothetical protein